MNTSFMHSLAWKRFQEKTGKIVIRKDEVNFLEENLPFWQYYTWYRAEVKANFDLPELPQKVSFLKVEPVDETSLEALKDLSHGKFSLVKSEAIQPKQTSIVDISGTDEEILQKFSQKHRYNTRLAEKKDVEVQSYSGTLANEVFERFWALLSQTAERQTFATHSKEYYRLMVEELSKDNLIHILIAHLENEDLATMILITYEETATYLHGGSSEQNKQLMAPLLLQYEAMKLAKTLGGTSYDLWGTNAIYDEAKQSWQPQVGHASEGVTRFKLGFGGTIIQYPGAYDLILRPFWYSTYKAIKALRGKKSTF